MKEILVGYTGFVGSNIVAKHHFDGLYNSKNIKDAYGVNPDLLVYSGIRAEMFLANKFPNKDLASMDEALENIRQINPKRLVLISTISVYNNPVGIDEDAEIDSDALTAYGKNRHYLEVQVRKQWPDAIIVRLPALYGEGIKKNFIYDLVHFIPAMLNEKKYNELSCRDALIAQKYESQYNGFYRCNASSHEEKTELKQHFEQLGFSALNFTDSRSQYQFYNLGYLWEHIQKALDHNLTILNPATEPVTIAELSAYIMGQALVNEIRDDYPVQDYRCKYASLLGGVNGYLFDKTFVMDDIKNFVNRHAL